MIGWYVHHHGLGHAQRFTTVARRLARPVTGLGSAPPPDWDGPWVALDRDDRPAPDDRTADPTANGRLHWVPLHHDGLRARGAVVASWVAQTAPQHLVVDVSAEVTLLARLLGVPVTVVAMQGDRTDPAHRLAYDVADRLIAPWPVGPDGEPGWPASWAAKTVHVGALSRFDGLSAPDPDRLARASAAWANAGRRVLALWGSGGDDVTPGQRHEAVRATPDWSWLHRGASSPASPDLWAELHAADVVVVHGGQNAVGEVAAARRPAVVVAQDRPHAEQVHRTRRLRERGIATAVDAWPAAQAWPGLLERAVAAGGGRWSQWLDGHGGERFAEAVERL